MKKIIPIFLLVWMAISVCGCSFHSYQTAITEIEIPHYRKPDSLNMVDEKRSVASMLWQDYYRDKNLSALIDSAIHRNLSLYSSFLQMERRTVISVRRTAASGLLWTSVWVRTRFSGRIRQMPSISMVSAFRLINGKSIYGESWPATSGRQWRVRSDKRLPCVESR